MFDKNLIANLNLAHRLQKIIMPDINIQNDKIKVMSKNKPADYLSGDFYSAFELDQNKLCLYLGDISGHGISSALLVSNMIYIINKLAQRNFMPNEILFNLNQEFMSEINNSCEIYACISIFIIDLASKKIFYSNAGMPEPKYISQDLIIQNLKSTGTPIGLLKASHYKSHTINFNHGDKIFLYTDGLENNFYKKTPGVFNQELDKILLEHRQNNFSELTQAIFNKFYLAIDNKKKLKLNLDDTSLISCALL